ncbi:hypothetical protein TBC1_11982 [Lentimicrobium saccharophilum]|uniref:DUF1648 domain-containing protein n=1 Tax=Lentimicrobium saccharophilum TaxID=1678841 RepID=A0A0S7BQE6_9BACT|nr:DUF1648 domain-containing protein [Lentimicrobium saccharophilum]GAP42842.1 hypothetical protein TBC1_11982 [Lentimicrobium saccharophilum]
MLTRKNKKIRNPLKPYRPPRYGVVLESAGWVVLAATWLFVLISYEHLPYIIPTHFDAAGQADAYGAKSAILMLPVISTVIFIVVSLVSFLPRMLSLKETLSPLEAGRKYGGIILLLVSTKLIMAAAFGYLAFRTIQQAKGNSAGLGGWFLPVFIALTFIPVLLFVTGRLRKT